MRIRLIALDIDGTLLDSASELPTANAEALAAAVEHGVEVVLVTGRRYDFALPIAQHLPFPVVMIVNNGAMVKSSDGATHLRRFLPREVAAGVIALAPAFRHYVSVVFDRPRANQIVHESMDWEDSRRRGYFQRNREFIAQMSPLESCLTEDPIQVMYSGGAAEMRQAETALRLAPPELAFSLAVTYYDHRDFGMVDVIRRGCSKGSTLAQWAERCGLSRAEIMAIGDNFNDREMLEFAGLPIVMGNSVPELKTMGWRETLSNDEAGVAAAIEEHILAGTADGKGDELDAKPA